MKPTLAAVAGLALAGCVTNESISGWSFVDGGTSPKPYAYAVVKAADGHPVRSGETSMRFEVRSGDCGGWFDWDDCSTDRERKELRQGDNINVGERWYAWSIYLPEDFPSIWPAKLMMGQFHVKGSYLPAFVFVDEMRHYRPKHNRGVMRERKAITIDSMRGRWTDILVHVKWTLRQDGFFRVYVNGDTRPAYYSFGPTRPKTPHEGIFFKFGVYRSMIYRRFITNPKAGGLPAQVVYYDDVRKGRTCEDIARYFDCGKIEPPPE